MDKSKTALILIDIQNDFCSIGGVLGKLGKNVKRVQSVMPNIHSILNYCRENELFTIFVKTVHGESTNAKHWIGRFGNSVSSLGICETEWGQDFYEIQPVQGEPVITKNRYSAFQGTNLDLILRSKEINTILLCGFTASVCVESTAREGYMKNYRVITISDCTEAYEDHEYQSAVYHLKTYFGEVMHSNDLKVTWS